MLCRMAQQSSQKNTFSNAERKIKKSYCPCNTPKTDSFFMACFITVFGLVQCETQQLLLCN